MLITNPRPGLFGRLQINSHSGTGSLSSCLLRASLLFPLLPQSKQLCGRSYPGDGARTVIPQFVWVLSRWLPSSVLLQVTLDGAIPYLLCRHSDVKSRQHSLGELLCLQPSDCLLVGFQEGPRT